MKTLRFVSSIMLATCLTASAATAQEQTALARDASHAVVTISVTSEGVRLAALGPVSRTRLEVFAPSGETVYATGFLAGGDAAVTTQGNGLILRATDGPLCYRLTVNNLSQLSIVNVTCP
jgi:hypothetical protein